MAQDKDNRAYYNLEGGQRYLVEKGGEVKAVAPGLRLVEATDAETRAFQKRAGRKKAPREYGLPV